MFFVIAGFGHVGSAVFEKFAAHHSVAVVDPKINVNVTVADYPNADGIIICVPTPGTQAKGYDSVYIKQVLDTCPLNIPILIKSTVSPFVVDELFRKYPRHDITYSPEYLTEANAVKEFANQKVSHMGGCNVEFWTTVWYGMFKDCQVWEGPAREICFQKMARNAFLATKVIWFNELKRVCKENLLDYDTVIEYMKHDDRIGSTHMQVPGPDGQPGYGGTCFPKEVDSLLNMSYNEFTLLTHTRRKNTRLRNN